jgi:hypothetical protein
MQPSIHMAQNFDRRLYTTKISAIFKKHCSGAFGNIVNRF